MTTDTLFRGRKFCRDRFRDAFVLTAPLVTILGALVFYTPKNKTLISWQPGSRRALSLSDPLRYHL